VNPKARDGGAGVYGEHAEHLAPLVLQRLCLGRCLLARLDDLGDGAYLPV
jgi:hypothetical protein